MLADILILLCFLLCLTGLGAVVIAGLRRLWGATGEPEATSVRNGWLAAGVCLCVGQGVYSFVLWIAGSLGLFVIMAWFGVLLGGAYLIYRIIFWVRSGRCKFPFQGSDILINHWRSISAWTMVLVVSLWLGNQYAIISLAGPIEGVPGLGNWAYKTKIIYLNRGIPSNYFSDYATHYGKFSYPAGFPMLNAAYYTLIGDVDEALIKLHSVILLTLTYAILAGCFLQRWRLWGIVPVIGILPLFLNEACLQIMRSFYSEPLLLFCAVVALTSINLNRSSICSLQNIYALLCAGCAAWVKLEGILFFAFLAVLLLILCWKDSSSSERLKKSVLPWLRITALIACIFILPWKIFTLCHSVDDSDFDFRGSNMIDTGVAAISNKDSKTQAAVSKVYELAIKHGHHYAGLFWIAPGLILMACFMKYRALWLFSVIALGTIGVYIFVMAWSQHEIDWHLSATHRYLMLPALCVAAGLSTINYSSRNNQKKL